MESNLFRPTGNLTSYTFRRDIMNRGSQPTPTRTEAEDETLVLDALDPARGPPLKLTPACFELFGKEKCSGVGAVQQL